MITALPPRPANPPAAGRHRTMAGMRFLTLGGYRFAGHAVTRGPLPPWTMGGHDLQQAPYQPPRSQMRTRHILVSTVSVYRAWSTAPPPEASATLPRPPDPGVPRGGRSLVSLAGLLLAGPLADGVPRPDRHGDGRNRAAGTRAGPRPHASGRGRAPVRLLEPAFPRRPYGQPGYRRQRHKGPADLVRPEEDDPLGGPVELREEPAAFTPRARDRHPRARTTGRRRSRRTADGTTETALSGTPPSRSAPRCAVRGWN